MSGRASSAGSPRSLQSADFPGLSTWRTINGLERSTATRVAALFRQTATR
jgi:hypothetical protein